MNKLQQDYEKVCDDYIKEFCDKQGMDFGYWVSNIVGNIAVFGDFSFNFPDIVWDINSDQPKGQILDWYNECIEYPLTCTNYYAYCKINNPKKK